MSGFVCTIALHEGEVEVHGNAWKASRGEREVGTGLQLSPDEPAGFVVENVYYKGMDVTDIVDIELVETKVWKELSE